ncbi:MAG: SIS domain-containing protein, partial [Clostridia bacterium]|nr:SIS domain-containing protein [Clostridia bacterium]
SISNSGRNAVPVLLAKAARERGAYVIALTSMNHTTAVTSRNSLNLRLFETADLILDNGGVLGDASVSFADGAMVGPTSTAVGATVAVAVGEGVASAAAIWGAAAGRQPAIRKAASSSGIRDM